MTITRNGDLLLFLHLISESDLEESLAEFRQACAVEAVECLHRQSAYQGTDKMPMGEIDYVSNVRTSFTQV